MNAKNVFDGVMKRCDDIIAVGGSACYEDMLRLAVVLGVAAFERYLKDRFLMSFVPYLKSKMSQDGTLSLNDACTDLLTKYSVNESFWIRVANKKAKQPYRSIRNKVRKHLYSMAIQNEKTIHKLYDSYGMGGIVANAVGKAERKNIWKSLEDFIKRRHLVAHHGDMLTTGKVRRIDKQYVIRRLSDLKSFVDGMECVLLDRFSGRKKTSEKVLSKDPHLYLAAYYREKGYLDARERPALKRISEIEKLFGTKAVRNGFLYEGVAPVPSSPGHELWWPQIASAPNYAGWKNEVKLDADGMVESIVERKVNGAQKGQLEPVKNTELNMTRIVFAKIDGETCPFGYCYRFLGLYKLNVEKSQADSARVWVRIAERFDIVTIGQNAKEDCDVQ